MSRIFKNPNELTNSSDFINRKKCETIYRDVLQKSKYPSCKKQNEIYINPVTKCLTGANSYNSLLNVTKGYYYKKKPSFKNYNKSNIWMGQYYMFDNKDLCVIKAAPGDKNLCNRIKYPSNQDNSPSHYPLPTPVTEYYPNAKIQNSYNVLGNETPEYIGHNRMIVDPDYNVFYTDNCSNLNNLDYIQHIKLNKKILLNKQFLRDQKNSDKLSDFTFPKKFKFTC